MTLDELRQECLNCQNCSLCETRTNVVFSDGNPQSSVMFVGEAPGKNEDEQGVPFVGRAGELLNSFLAAVGIERSEIYITNILKCRPPANRDPNPAEQEACIQYLRTQFSIIRPKIVVCLGRIAAKRLIDDKFLVTRDHGRFFTKSGSEFMGTFHPAALLRNPNNKADALQDFKQLAEHMRALGI